jgi:osmotically-inducible protein OsmY
MYRIALCVLLLATASVAQTPQQTPAANPSPSPDQSAQQQTPPAAHQDMSENNSRIQRSVEDLLRGDPVLSSADIQTTVDDYAITLTGHVDSYAQHQRVMALVNQYSRYRKIVDKLQTR